MSNKIKPETMSLMHNIQTKINRNESGLRWSKRITKQKRKGRSKQAQSTRQHWCAATTKVLLGLTKCPHTDKVTAQPTHKVTWIVFTKRTIHWNQLQRMLEAMKNEIADHKKRSHRSMYNPNWYIYNSEGNMFAHPPLWERRARRPKKSTEKRIVS